MKAFIESHTQGQAHCPISAMPPGVAQRALSLRWTSRMRPCESNTAASTPMAGEARCHGVPHRVRDGVLAGQRHFDGAAVDIEDDNRVVGGVEGSSDR